MQKRKHLHLPFRRKLILSFVINGACMLAALVYAIAGLTTMHRTVGDIAHNDLAAATATITLRDGMLAQERTARRFMILGQAELIEVHARQAEVFKKSINLLKERTQLSTLPHLIASHDAYLALTVKLFNEKSVRESALKSAAVTVETAIERLRAEQQQILEQKLMAAKSKEAQTSAWALVLAFSGVALSVVVAVVLVYTFSTSINKLQQATHRIAAGDFEHDPQIPAGDEIGTLAQDFMRMGQRLKELEQISLDASPLTRLPGNIAIERSITKRLREQQPFAMCYLDLDNFKSYNDHYGYIKASELIKEAGYLIHTVVEGLGDPEAFVGHIGGDDFVVIINHMLAKTACQTIIRDFDAMIPRYYSEHDRAAGFIEGVDRYGVARRFPLVTISIAVLNCQPGKYSTAAEIATAAAEVKDRVKESSGSNYIIVREAGSG
ncbi:diguanylate cyclase domain-containing protein [Trichlorobacter sp.]|jgi:diguanylate cyclase (GGDEF)-like protein|uniref:diguanylate cyclase domain-containing protein n=1 Tax=Trichlorobacter sp. TaxID=2911007 RepID=UPI002A35DE5B|nr:diguanylate cyclase [Trichlorobacter sp.]MDY0384379.1 diguanylate cyclase [Trichlorobacter sp.]